MKQLTAALDIQPPGESGNISGGGLGGSLGGWSMSKSLAWLLVTLLTLVLFAALALQLSDGLSVNVTSSTPRNESTANPKQESKGGAAKLDAPVTDAKQAAPANEVEISGMPIFVKESPEPFTFGSASSPPLLAECEAYRCLLASILRYGKREIMGRSVLISGHRGCGKTTLVRWAVRAGAGEIAPTIRRRRVPGAGCAGHDLQGGESVLATDQKSGRSCQAARGERTIGIRAPRCSMLTEALHRAYVSGVGGAPCRS